VKKWIIFFSVLFLVVISVSILIYFNSRKPLETDTEKAVARAKEESSIESIDETSYYNSSKSYIVIRGKNAEEEDIIVWVPKKSGEIVEKKWANGITEKQAINKLKDEKQPKEILSVHLGLESVGPVWEITYLDDKEHLNYFYLLFENGEWWRKIENL
jgi:uncharacterized protein YpmB